MSTTKKWADLSESPEKPAKKEGKGEEPEGKKEIEKEKMPERERKPRAAKEKQATTTTTTTTTTTESRGGKVPSSYPRPTKQYHPYERKYRDDKASSSHVPSSPSSPSPSSPHTSSPSPSPAKEREHFRRTRPRVFEIEQETDPVRLKNRQKQIDYGKNTIGYQIYLQQVPLNQRKKGDPMTPNKFQKCSKRSWDGQVKIWRRSLHKYDPQGEDAGEDINLETAQDGYGQEDSSDQEDLKQPAKDKPDDDSNVVHSGLSLESSALSIYDQFEG